MELAIVVIHVKKENVSLQAAASDRERITIHMVISSYTGHLGPRSTEQPRQRLSGHCILFTWSFREGRGLGVCYLGWAPDLGVSVPNHFA